MSWWCDPQLIDLFTRATPLIDVRAPIEYAAGAIPGSVNLPLMNDEERHLVGLCYKKNGQAAAVALGPIAMAAIPMVPPSPVTVALAKPAP